MPQQPSPLPSPGPKWSLWHWISLTNDSTGFNVTLRISQAALGHVTTLEAQLRSSNIRYGKCVDKNIRSLFHPINYFPPMVCSTKQKLIFHCPVPQFHFEVRFFSSASQFQFNYRYGMELALRAHWVHADQRSPTRSLQLYVFSFSHPLLSREAN